jgi:type II secretory pathway component GspD/PulD (secretin)
MKRIFLIIIMLLFLEVKVGGEEFKSVYEEDIEGVINQTILEMENALRALEEKPSLIAKAKETVESSIEEKPLTSDTLNIIEELKEPIDLEFTQAELEDVLRVIAEAGKFNIIVDPALKGRKVDLHIKKSTIPEILRILSTAYDIGFCQVGNTIFFSTKQKIKDSAVQTKIFPLKNIDVNDAKELLGTLAKEINVSKETNTLIIRASPEEMAKIEEILSKIDVACPQVLLEAKVIEINRDKLKELGIDWSNSVSVTFQESKRKVEPDDPAVVVGPPLRIYKLTRTPLQFEMVLKALEESGEAKVLSSPRITTLNNKEAEIFIGDKVPYTITTVTGGVATTEVRFAEAGIRLKITPSIIKDDFTVIKIEPEVSYIYGWRGPKEEYPWVKTRQATAYVRVKNKQCFVIGGLLGKEDKHNLYKVPLLGDIPLLGNLFKYKKTAIVNNEIIISITPTIITQKS